MSSNSRSSLQFWLLTVTALLAVALTSSLGRWQLSRAVQKETLQARLVQQASLPDLVAGDVLASKRAGVPPGPDDALLDRRLHLFGQWLPEQTLLLDNRPMNGRQGFYILTPLREQTTGQVVMVQRGWVQRDFNDREKVQAFETPTGTVQVTGRIARGPSQTLVLAGGDAPLGDVSVTPSGQRIRQNLNLEVFRAESRLPLWDHLLLQTGPVADGLQRDWPAPNLGVDKHHGYAFQWFGLSALIAVLYVWFQLVPRFRRKTS